MTTAQKNLKVGLALMMLVASVNLTACGKRLSPTSITQPIASATPYQEPYQEPYVDPTNNINNSYGGPSVATGVPNTQSGSFKVDQATFNQWQARGIAVGGGSIYVSVADTTGLSKKGAIVKMNSSDGKSWKNLTSKLLGLSNPLDATVMGLAVSGGTIIAVDTNSKVYSVDASSGKVTTLKTAGGTDVTAGAGSLFIANGAVEKSDASASSRTPIMGLSATAVGSDNLGNVYAVSGNTIKKADPQGQVQDVVTTDLAGPLDVAVDSRSGDIYVLEQSMIKRFTTNGQFVVSFSNGATKAVSIATDETGAVYVADAGSSNKDSKVIKFAPATDALNNSQMNAGYNNSSYGYGTTNTAYGNSGYGNTNSTYGTYSAPATTNTRAASTTTTKTNDARNIR